MGNKENEYPVPDPQKTMINVTNDSHKKKIPQRRNHGRDHREIHGEATGHS
jgi:hypothetical protein